MAGRNKEPVDVLIAKGKKHLTKDEIAKRRAEEMKVEVAEDLTAPDYLNAAQKREYEKIAEQLANLGIFTDLDIDCLARYVISKFIYLEYTKQMKKIMTSSKNVNKFSIVKCRDDEDTKEILKKILQKQHISELEIVQRQQDKAFKQCQSCARDLGLTITSRARLVVPDLPSDDEEL